jgi:mannose-6-phosphate isomerase-like protein (cupin superfamily)
VRQEQLQAALTMSGGRIELEEGAMRELHWHTNVDELHYVLSGCVRNIVHNNVDFPNTKPKEYTICAGDIGYVPKNFVHYLEAISGPATVIATFNHPSWGTQGLSAIMSVTPVDVTASTLTTTVEVAEKYFPKESTAFLKKLPVTKTISEDPCTCENGKAKIWGPGGPHTALIPVAELFNAQVNTASDKQKTQIEICYGPESQWRSEALKCASGLMTAAEQQLAGFIRL